MKKITEIILDKEAPLNLKSLWAEPQEDSTVELKVFNNGKWASTSTKVDLSAYQTKTDESLQTSDKTIAGAINELNSNIGESGYNLVEYGVTTYDELVEMAGNGKPSYLYLVFVSYSFLIPISLTTHPNEIFIGSGICYATTLSKDSSYSFGIISLPIFSITNENVWPDTYDFMGSLLITNDINELDYGDRNFAAPSCETVKNYVSEQLESYAKISYVSATYQPKGDYATTTALTEGLAGKQNATDNSLDTTNKTIIGAINELKTAVDSKQDSGDYALKNQLPSYTTVPELTADYTVPANATTREFIYQIPVGATPHNITGAEGIKWASGVAPTTQMNHTYIVSVINNLAVWGEF